MNKCRSYKLVLFRKLRTSLSIATIMGATKIFGTALVNYHCTKNEIFHYGFLQ